MSKELQPSKISIAEPENGELRLIAMTPTQRRQRAIELVARRVETLMHEHRIKNRAELARRLEISQPQVSQFLNGKRGVSWEVLDDMAKLFGVTVPELFSAPVLTESDLVEEEQELLAAYRQADARTRRAIATLLELPDAHIRPPAAPLPADSATALADILTEAVDRLRRSDVSRPGTDRRPDLGTSHRRPATRHS